MSRSPSGRNVMEEEHRGFEPQWGDSTSQVMRAVKNLPARKGDMSDAGLIPGLGRSPGGGHGNPLQYSCLENPMHRGNWRATAQIAKSPTWLKWLSMHRPGQWWEEYGCLQKLNNQNSSEARKLTRPSLPLSCLPTLRGWNTAPNPSPFGFYIHWFLHPIVLSWGWAKPTPPSRLVFSAWSCHQQGVRPSAGARPSAGGPAISSTVLSFLLYNTNMTRASPLS